jgi:hypothetical protein
MHNYQGVSGFEIQNPTSLRGNTLTKGAMNGENKIAKNSEKARESISSGLDESR